MKIDTMKTHIELVILLKWDNILWLGEFCGIISLPCDEWSDEWDSIQ